MTIEEAIKEIELANANITKINTKEQDEAYRMAIEALKKQIPTIPDYEGEGCYNGEIIIDTWVCPNCAKEYEVDYDDYDYCPNCGQHIDHSTLTEDD